MLQEVYAQTGLLVKNILQQTQGINDNVSTITDMSSINV